MSYLIIAAGCLACLGWAWLDSTIESFRRANQVIEEARRIIREDDGHKLTEASDV